MFTLISMVVCAASMIFTLPVHPEPTPAIDSGNILDVLVGEWEGEATAYYPRVEGREPRHETVKVVSTKVLKDTYVRSDAVWTNTNGEDRYLLIYWTYNKRDDVFDILFLYDDWPGKVNYPLSYDAEKRIFTGNDTFTGRGGVPAKERVEWHFSEDGKTITSNEYNHYETDPEDYWVKSFEFVWRKKE